MFIYFLSVILLIFFGATFSALLFDSESLLDRVVATSSVLAAAGTCCLLILGWKLRDQWKQQHSANLLKSACDRVLDAIAAYQDIHIEFCDITTTAERFDKHPDTAAEKIDIKLEAQRRLKEFRPRLNRAAASIKAELGAIKPRIDQSKRPTFAKIILALDENEFQHSTRVKELLADIDNFDLPDDPAIKLAGIYSLAYMNPIAKNLTTMRVGIVELQELSLNQAAATRASSEP